MATQSLSGVRTETDSLGKQTWGNSKSLGGLASGETWSYSVLREDFLLGRVWLVAWIKGC